MRLNFFFFFGFPDKSQCKWGQLKTLGTQIGYPIRAFIWVVVKINEHTFFGRLWQAEEVSTPLTIYHLLYSLFL